MNITHFSKVSFNGYVYGMKIDISTYTLYAAQYSLINNISKWFSSVHINNGEKKGSNVDDDDDDCKNHRTNNTSLLITLTNNEFNDLLPINNKMANKLFT